MNPSGKRRVIIVDDSVDGTTLATLLQHEGCETLQVPRGTDVVADAISFSPDAVLTDLALGGVPDGLEIVRRLREQPELNHVVIAAVTGSARPQDMVAAEAAGCDRLFAKPVEPGTLLNFVLSIDRRRNSASDWPVENERRATMDRG